MPVTDQKIKHDEDCEDNVLTQPSDNISLYDNLIKIIGCIKVEDYDGNPAVVIGYAWTNNSDKPMIFDKAIDSEIYQSGNKLVRTVVSVRYDEFDMEAAYAEVESGETITVYHVYRLKNESDIVIRLSSWYDFGSDEVIERVFKLQES